MSKAVDAFRQPSVLIETPELYTYITFISFTVTYDEHIIESGRSSNSCNGSCSSSSCSSSSHRAAVT